MSSVKSKIFFAGWMMCFLVGCASGQKSVKQDTDAVPPPMADAASTEFQSASLGGPGAEGAKSYKIRRGDTLMKIAYSELGDLSRWKELYQNNKAKISDPNSIPVGVVIALVGVSPAATPEGEKYLIKHGDTLGKISAQLYGTPARWKEIYEHNRQLIHDPNKIFAGFSLYYSSEGVVSPVPSLSPNVPVLGSATQSQSDLNAVAAEATTPPNGDMSTAQAVAQPSQGVDPGGGTAPAGQ